MSQYQIPPRMTVHPLRHKKSFQDLSYREVIFLLLGCILFVPVPVSAQVSSVEINYFSRCRQVYDERDRLACYDDLYDRALRAANPQAAADRLMEENRRMREELARIRSRTGSAPVRSDSRADDFGRNEPYRVKRNEADDFGREEPYVVKGDDGEAELIGRIASLQKTNTGWIVILEQGQVWRQMVSKRYDLHEGQEVRIYPTRWGDSYRLTAADTSGFIQVQRIE